MWALLKGGRVIDPSRGIDEIADVLIENGRISNSLPSQGRVGERSDGEVYDCSGLIVCPGLVDMHVHLREPGFEHKETIRTGAEAAAAGGFTTVVAMPNTEPAVDNRAVVEYVIRQGKDAAVNVLTSCAATKSASTGLSMTAQGEMAEIGEMVEAGAVAVSDDAHPVQSADLMRRVMEYSRMFDVPVLTHCEDKSMTADAIMNEGVTATTLGLRPWPRQAEEIMIWRNILLADLTRCRVHIQHLTTKGGVEAIRWAKSRGISVTCETCPQYFSLTDKALETYDTNAKCNPPLRTESDVDAIKQGLADGTIDAIATDHAPHAREDKEVELAYAAFGMVGLETALALTITNLVKPGVLSINDAIAKLTVAPAAILSLSSVLSQSKGAAGTLAEGAPADITIIDPDAQVTVRSSEFRSLGSNTPFEGFELTGKAVATIVSGEFASGALKIEQAKARVGSA